MEKAVKVVVRTDEYTIFEKRNSRYGVRKNDRQWVNGDDKVAILREHDLIKAPAPKPAEPEPAEDEAAAEAAEGETADQEPAAEEASADEAPAEDAEDPEAKAG